jgi:hypothetical protein
MGSFIQGQKGRSAFVDAAGCSGRAVAVVEPVATGAGDGGAPGAAERMTDRAAADLGGDGESATERGRTSRDVACCH